MPGDLGGPPELTEGGTVAGTIEVEQRGRVLLATLANAPHALMDRPMVAALDDLVRRAETDPDVGGVVLTGAHPERFVAHYDVGELLSGAESGPAAVAPGPTRAALRAVRAARRVPGADAALSGTPVAGLVQLERFHEVFLRMNSCGAVFVAALNGSAMGAGCELALACDFRLMARGEFGVGQPEILFGFPPGGGGTQRLARMLGTTRALRLVLDGGPLTPDQAAELGIVDRVVAAGELIDAAVADAARLGSRIKAAVAASKRAVYLGGSLPLPDGIRVEEAEFLSTIATDDARAAMRAYVEQLESRGELPGYDPEVMQATLERGRFA
ncbi:MAG TPA: enoyl-CoA hydratase/isomerase family protein [Solirubrobacteraceae bacterium]|nr:enoyl-CoA hydratase/isomerase family protein [Solirubrobacteraceae bacterium]